MHYRTPSPPPSYSTEDPENEGKSRPLLTQQPPQDTGPIEYSGSPSLEGLIYLFIFLKPLVKFLCGLHIFVAIMQEVNNQTRRQQPHQRNHFAMTPADLRSMLFPASTEPPPSPPSSFFVLFCVGVFFLTLVNCLNFWEWPYLIFKPFQTMDRFKICRPGYCLFGLSLFIIDCSILFGYIALALWRLLQYGEVMLFIIIAATITLLVNILIFAMIHIGEIRAYSPLTDTAKYFLFRRTEQLQSSREKPLTIRESGPFRIVIENCGRNAWVNPLVVHRRISYTCQGRHGPYWKSEDVWFIHRLIEPLEPGNVVTFIPRTHHEEGSYRIRGFRSFGRGKGEIVETSINNDNYMAIVTLKEEYNVNMAEGRRNITLNFGKRTYCGTSS